MSNNDPRDQGELWHRRMGQVHHGALKMLRDAVIGVPKVSTKHDDVCRDVCCVEFSTSIR